MKAESFVSGRRGKGSDERNERKSRAAGEAWWRGGTKIRTRGAVY